MPGDGHDIDQTSIYQPVGGPSLIDPGFLKSASNGFLKAAIMCGREGTRMPAFFKASAGAKRLEETDIDNIVFYLRDRGRR
jgi:hypothetical protein